MRNVPEPAFQFFMRFATGAGTASRGTSVLKELLRIDVGDDGAGAQRRAVVQHDAGGAAALDDDLAHRGAHIDADAMLAGGARHRLGDRAHAADGMAPRALPAVHLAEHVMQQHIGGAGRVGAREVPHHRIEPEHGLDGIGFEPAVEDFARGFAQQADGRASIRRPATISRRSPASLPSPRAASPRFPNARLGGASRTRSRSTPATRPISA